MALHISGSPAAHSGVPTRGSGPSARIAGDTAGTGAGGGNLESSLAVSC